MLTRQAVKARRQAAVLGPLYGLFLFLFVKILSADYAIAELQRQTDSSQPAFVQELGALNPWLNLTLCCFYLWLATYLVAVKLPVLSKPEGWPNTPKHWLQIAVMIFVGGGALGGGLFSALAWFPSMKIAPLVGAGSLVIFVVMCILYVSLCWLDANVPPFVRWLGGRMNHLWVAQPFIWLRDFLQAQGVPEDKQ